MTATLEDVEPEEILRAIRAARRKGDLRALKKLLAGLRASLAWKPLPHQLAPPGDWWMWCNQGGRGCVAAGTLIYDPVNDRHVPVEQRTEPGWVLTFDGPVFATQSFRKGMARLFRVRTDTGDAVVVTAEHRFLTPTGWVPLGRMSTTSVIAAGVPTAWPADGQRSSGTHGDSPACCSSCCRRCGRRLPSVRGTVRPLLQRRGDAPRCSSCSAPADGQAPGSVCSHPYPMSVPTCRNSCVLAGPSLRGAGYPIRSCVCGSLPQAHPTPRSCPESSGRSLASVGAAPGRSSIAAESRPEVCTPGASLPIVEVDARSSARTLRTAQRGPRASLLLRTHPAPTLEYATWTRIVSVEPVGDGVFYDLTVPGPAHYLAEGLWHHNSGKSDGGAHWFNEHMEGPPCDTRVPGGHKGFLLGPTHGACMAGVWDAPHGISGHNPAVQKVGRKGGTYLVWPNGAEAFVAGGHTEQEAEQIRSHVANTCVAEGTLVTTMRGAVPIERVQVGDLVATRSGWRRVSAVHDQGIRPTYEIETASGRRVELTGDHEVWTDRGWLEAAEVHQSVTRMAAWVGEETSNGADAPGISVPTATTGTDETSSTEPSTGSITARSRADSMCITATETRRTTTRRTSSPSRRAITQPSILTSRSGTPVAVEQQRRPGPMSKPPVPSAVRGSSVRDGGSAPVDVVTGTTPRPAQAGHTRKGCARCAVLASPPDPRPVPRPALDPVRRVSDTGRAARVYDLTVDHAHEFYAGELLVSNCVWWVDEGSTTRHLRIAVDNLSLGARLGPRPHGIMTSTPKPTPQYKYVTSLPNVVVTKASTFDNPYLPDHYLEQVRRFEGTRLEAQELHGELLDDYEGALWIREWIDATRIREYPIPPLERIAAFGIVRTLEGIDPSTWDPDLGDDPGTVGEGIETGIVVAGIDGRDPAHIYVFDDLSLRARPEVWGQTVLDGYDRWGVNALVPETNVGALSVSTIRSLRSDVNWFRVGKRIGIKAKDSKRVRAEPVSNLYEQGRVHHVGEFPALEASMVQWDPQERWSPDRIDALVYAITALDPWSVKTSRSGTGAAIRGRVRR